MTAEMYQRAGLVIRDAILYPEGQRTEVYFCAHAGALGAFGYFLKLLQYIHVCLNQPLGSCLHHRALTVL